MVRNLKGGTGHKKLARKNENRSYNNKLRLPDNELEIFGSVTKMYGNGMCQITTNDNNSLMGHIRGSFRGKHKRHNTITTTSIVLVGLREWESTQKNCDILTIYNDSDLEQIKNLPNINIEYLLSLRIGASNYKDDSDFDFTNSVEEESEPNTIIPTNNFKISELPNVDVNDI